MYIVFFVCFIAKYFNLPHRSKSPLPALGVATSPEVLDTIVPQALPTSGRRAKRLSAKLSWSQAQC